MQENLTSISLIECSWDSCILLLVLMIRIRWNRESNRSKKGSGAKRGAAPSILKCFVNARSNLLRVAYAQAVLGDAHSRESSSRSSGPEMEIENFTGIFPCEINCYPKDICPSLKIRWNFWLSQRRILHRFLGLTTTACDGSRGEIVYNMNRSVNKRMLRQGTSRGSFSSSHLLDWPPIPIQH